ncbi:MAG TPA: histidine--tRNA ligase [Bauldia sp.]|nr:histidine--tRNA ligase [Bauldia sp.]
MSKTSPLKARLPRGFADRSAADIRATERMLATIRQVYERYGFEPVETPLVEYTDALGKFLPDLDRPNEGVFSFQDEDAQEARSAGGATGKHGEWLSLRYDLTAPLARYVAENWERLPKPYRSYRAGWVFRNEKPGPGRFRQFMQFDADTVGAASPAADAEICMMAADTLEALGIPRGQYMVKVNSRKVLDGVMEAAGVAEGAQRLIVLRAIDKLDRLGLHGVRELLGPGRKDESGDFTKGAGLGEAAIATIVGMLDFDSEAEETIASLDTLLARSEIGQAGRAELQMIADYVTAAGYDDRVEIDPSVVRGLEYYTGPVFEAQLLFEIPNEQGQPVVFGSVGGGGRYDGLVGRFMNEPVPATGFSVGVSRLQAALAALNPANAEDAAGPVVVLVMDRDRIGEYQAMVAKLRHSGVAAEMYLGESGMRAQMKYADRRNAPLVVIQGGDEKAKGVVQIKDLAEGKRLSGAVADNAAWRTERPGQFEVPEAELVAAVKQIVGLL